METNIDMDPVAVLGQFPAHGGTLHSLLETRALAAPDKTFLEFRSQSFSYRDMARLVRDAAAMYAARGVGRGDRVGVMSASHVTSVVTFFALARLGAAMCPVNHGFKLEEARFVLQHAQLKGVLCSPACQAVVEAAFQDDEERPWILLNERAAGYDGPDWEAGMAAHAGGPVPVAAGCPQDTCVIIYTSGTTGTPKGVMHAQRSALLAGEGFVARMYLQRRDRLLCILPLFHINGLFYSVCGAAAAGATVILQESFSASTFWQTVKRTRATEVNFVAAIPAILGKRPRSEFIGGHQLRKICVAPLSVATEQLLREEFGVEHLLNSYGMTEIPGVAITPLHGERRSQSAGKLCQHPDPALKFAELRVVDDHDADVAPGTVGEFLVRTPTLMQGYFRDPEQTQASLRDGWFATGDLGFQDADGFVWFVARKKDIIRKRGENISGAELDRVVGEHPDVQEAAAIAVPSGLGEDEILVVVVAVPGTAPTAQDIAHWCRERLSSIKVPRYVVFADSLPHTPTHRVAKHKLKADTGLLARATDLQPAGIH